MAGAFTNFNIDQMQYSAEKYQLCSLSFFDMMSREEAAFVRSRSLRKEFKKGQALMREGSFSKGVYVISKGRVKLHSSNDLGKESIVYIYEKGDFFGYRPLIAGEPNPVSATAIDAVTALYIPKAVFEELLRSSNTALGM